MDEYQTEEQTEVAGLLLLQQYAESSNIAEFLEEQQLDEIGRRCVEDYETDDGTREEWLKDHKEAIKLAKQTREEKSYPWPNAANVKYPLITTAAIQFNARAYPAIVDGQNIVKGKVIGDDPDGQKEERAERIAEHMSYQLLDEMMEWEEETDQLTTILPIVGNVFRKTYYCPIKKRNVSKMIRAENFVFHADYSFSAAPRHTEWFELFPQQIIEMQRFGVFSDVDFKLEQDIEEEAAHEFIEQHTWYDLDGDGYKEPYIITVHLDTKQVARIVARYDIEDVTVRYGGDILKVKDILRQIDLIRQQNQQMAAEYQMVAQQMMAAGQYPPPPPQMLPVPEFDPSQAEVVKIDSVQYFTKYGFIPSVDGSGYDIGLGMLVGPLGETINTNLNQMLDAGTLANLQGGFIDRGLRIRKGEVRTAPNEWIALDNSMGGSIRDKVLPFNFRGPVPVMLQLLQFLVEAAQDITSVKDGMTGDPSPNEPMGSYLTRVQEGMKVFNAIYKRIHRSLGQEYKKLFRLNKLYLPDQTYFNILDNPQAIGRQDYQTEDVDVTPVSDPSIATTIQKMAKAQFAMQLAGTGNPHINLARATKGAIDAASLPEDYFIEQPQTPPPPPDLVAKVEKMVAETERIRAEADKTRAEITTVFSQYEKDLAEIRQGFEKLDIDRFGKTVDLLSKVVTEQENYQIYQKVKDEPGRLSTRPANPGRVPSVDIQPNDQESQLPVGPQAPGPGNGLEQG